MESAEKATFSTLLPAKLDKENKSTEKTILLLSLLYCHGITQLQSIWSITPEATHSGN